MIRNRWSYWKGKLGLSVCVMRINWTLEIKQSHAPFFVASFFCTYICSHLHVCIYVSFHFHKLKMTIDYFQTQLQQKTYQKRGCDKFGRITKACLIGRKQQFLDYNFTYYIVFNLGMEKKSVHSSYKWRLNALWLLFYVNPWLTALFNVARSCSAAKENSLSLSSMTEEESQERLRIGHYK